MMGWGYGGGFEWIFMALFWILAVIGLFILIRWLMPGHRRRWRDWGHSAMDTLKERYAKGEIGKEEFEEKKKDLEA